MECVTDSFDIIVRNIDDTTDTIDDTTDTIDDTTDTIGVTTTTDLTNSIAIISSMTVTACAACIASFSLPLIIGGGIVALRRYRNKISKDKRNTNAKKDKKGVEL
jgi:hypothetical protein